MIELAPLPFTIEADENGESRVLAGVAVPWNEVGVTSAGPVRFLPGSLPTGELPVLMRDHDRTKVCGMVVSAADSGTEMFAKAKVSRTVLGDETLTLAADGVLRGLSVGVEPVDFAIDSEGVMNVTSGRWVDLSVLSHQAFPSARVTHVQAKEASVETTVAEPPAVDPTAPVVPVITTKPRLPKLTAGQVAHVMILAQRGDRSAAELLQAIHAAQPPAVEVLAQLSPHDTGAGSVGIVPPTYTSDILGGLPVATPFLSNLVRKAGLPATGMSIIKPEWGTTPIGDWVATENTAPPSNPVTIGTKSVGVLTYAHAVQASLNLINRSDFGGFAQAYYAQVAIDYTAKKEVKAVVTTEGSATGVTFTATEPIGAIGELVAAQVAQQTNANGEFRGLMPEYAAVAADVWSALVETKVMAGPAFSSGSIQWGNLSGSLSGLVVLMIPSLGAGHMIVGARAAVVVYDEGEAQLRSTVVNTLSVELGVIANAAFDVEYPDALTKGTLVIASASETTTSRSKK